MMYRWTTDAGEAGAWWLYRAAPLRHRMAADNLSAEYPTKTQGHGRDLFEWGLRPGRDNHFLDATILSAVGASILGVKVPGEADRVVRRRKISMSDRAQSDRSDPAPSREPSPVEQRVEAVEKIAKQPHDGKMTLAELRALRRKSG